MMTCDRCDQFPANSLFFVLIGCITFLLTLNTFQKTLLLSQNFHFPKINIDKATSPKILVLYYRMLFIFFSSSYCFSHIGYCEQIENSATEMLERLEPLRAAAKSEAENLGHSVVQLVSLSLRSLRGLVGLCFDLKLSAQESHRKCNTAYIFYEQRLINNSSP